MFDDNKPPIYSALLTRTNTVGEHEGAQILENVYRKGDDADFSLPAEDRQIVTEGSIQHSTSDIISKIDDPNTPPEICRQLVCEAELCRFPTREVNSLLGTLWNYILRNRNSINCDDLVAVSSAMRKYIALIPLEDMEKVSELLETGHRASMAPELELEIAKMIYRNYEIYPPRSPNPNPKLAGSLWDIVQLYSNPRLISQPSSIYSTIACLSIVAIIAMQSIYAESALGIAKESPYPWFYEIVKDDVVELRAHWFKSKNKQAITWIDSLIRNI